MEKYTEVKIGRKVYEIKEGDFILDNGSCLQFCAGDGRTLKHQRWSSYSHLALPKSAAKQFDLNLLTKKRYKTQFGDILTRYFF